MIINSKIDLINVLYTLLADDNRPVPLDVNECQLGAMYLDTRAIVQLGHFEEQTVELTQQFFIILIVLSDPEVHRMTNRIGRDLLQKQFFFELLDPELAAEHDLPIYFHYDCFEYFLFLRENLVKSRNELRFALGVEYNASIWDLTLPDHLFHPPVALVNVLLVQPSEGGLLRGRVLEQEFVLAGVALGEHVHEYLPGLGPHAGFVQGLTDCVASL